jgi:tetratricopeptide (TPR) repeat protein
VANSNLFKYRAFLSCSHRDKAWCEWLYGALDRVRIDADLVGRATMAGPVPRDLRPLCRGNDDVDAGPSLKERAVAALDESQFLVVICSPHAAKSRHVNEEIRHFKSLGRSTHVIAVIVDGVPGDAEQECLPPALRVRIAPDGTETAEPEEPVTADVREEGGGKRIALTRVVARLIAVPFDELRARDVAAARRRTRRMATVAIVVAAFAVATAFFVWERHARRTTAHARNDAVVAVGRQRDNLALVQRLVASGRATPSPAREPSVATAIADLAKGAAAGDERSRQALDLLKANQVEEAIGTLQAVADGAPAADPRAAAIAWRDLGAVAALRDPRRARDAYARAAALDPDDAVSLFWGGMFDFETGNLAAAESAYRQSLAAKRSEPDSRAAFWAQLGLGAVEDARGRLDAALAAYLAARSSADRLAKADRTDVRRQFELAVGHERVGDIQRRQGDFAAALKSFRARHDIVSDLARAEPDNTEWQRDLSVSFNRIGEVLADEGDAAAALASFASALAIADRLAADPDNVLAQRDRAVSFERIGTVQVAQGRLPEALKSFRDARAIAERLTALDPGNIMWQRDRSIADARVGDVLEAQGDLPAALKAFRDSLAIRSRLAEQEPANATHQRDLSVSHDRVGDVLAAQGDAAGALDSFRESLAIRDRLSRADPGNTLWQHDLSVSHDRVGDVLAAQHRLQEALKSYRDGLAIRAQLANADPANASAQFDLVVSNWKLAANGDNAAGRFAQIVATLRKLKDEHRLAPAQERWLPVAEAELAKLGGK